MDAIGNTVMGIAIVVLGTVTYLHCVRPALVWIKGESRSAKRRALALSLGIWMVATAALVVDLVDAYARLLTLDAFLVLSMVSGAGYLFMAVAFFFPRRVIRLFALLQSPTRADRALPPRATEPRDRKAEHPV